MNWNRDRHRQTMYRYGTLSAKDENRAIEKTIHHIGKCWYGPRSLLPQPRWRPRLTKPPISKAELRAQAEAAVLEWRAKQGVLKQASPKPTADERPPWE
jgi:hypothetical protein